MPSRIDAHAYQHDSCLASANPKATCYTSCQCKLTREHVIRTRQKRTRFISGSGCAVDVVDGLPKDERTSCRTRRYSHVHCSSSNMSRHSRHPKIHKSLPSSPNSPCSLLNPTHHKTTIILDTFVSQNESSGNRVEQMEDENSFSSSVFSEHLAPSDMPMEINSAPNDSIKCHRSSLLPSDHHSLSDSSNKDPAQIELVKKIKTDMAGLFIHSDNEVSTPNHVTADDAGSSEGEDDNDGKEQGLIQSGETLRLPHDPIADVNLVSIVESPLIQDSCITANCAFTDDELAALSSGTFGCVQPSVSNPNGERDPRLSTPPLPVIPSPARSPVMLQSDVALPSRSSPGPSRMVTRSRTAELAKYTLSSSFVCSDSHSFIHNSSGDSGSTSSRSVQRLSLKSHRTSHLESSNNLDRVSPSCQCFRTSLISPPPNLHCDAFGVKPSPVSPRMTPNDISSGNGSRTGWTNSTELAPQRRSIPPNPDHSLFVEIPVSSVDAASCDLPSRRHCYPLRSRIRHELMRREWQAAQTAPKSFIQLPAEVVFRIAHYLSIQDVFRLQRVNRRLKAIVERYLLLVKRINFSNGLPFAFLPESITDSGLKRLLSRTPEVTHILGFYPRQIFGSYPADCHSLGGNRSGPLNTLTYTGIIAAFRICPRLRSVELMDVELMSKLVHFLPRIKFHGMFRNRPDSWDCEYAVLLPPELDSHESGGVLPSSQPQVGVSAPKKSAGVGEFPEVKSTLGYHLSSLFSSVTVVTSAFSSCPKSKSDKTWDCVDFKRLKSKFFSSLSFSLSSSKSSSKSFSLPRRAAAHASEFSLSYSDLATWFEPLGESPISHGSLSTMPHFLPSRPMSFAGNVMLWHAHPNGFVVPGTLESLRHVALAPFLQPGLPPVETELIPVTSYLSGPVADAPASAASVLAAHRHSPIMALAFGAFFVSPHLITQGFAAPVLLAPPGLGTDGLILANPLRNDYRAAIHPNGRSLVLPVVSPAPHGEESHPNLGQPNAPVARVPCRQAARRYVRQVTVPNACGPWLVSPLPNFSHWIGLPHAITNLTKLDLVSVSISAIPRLDNIKYLHLKWVVFASADPFLNFSATKLQSFVMNNCSGPSRVVRFVRIFSALARAPQLTRLELVGVRFVDGLLAHIVDVPLLPGRGFRNLQRLVLSSNKDATEVDVGLLLLAGQQSLNHAALQIAHTRNSLFESLHCAQASFPRLEYLILGYQDPYQSRLTISELVSLGFGDSSDQLTPVCGLNDWGISIVLNLCPRLSYLTIRHAPYLSSVHNWTAHSLPPAEQNPVNPSVVSGQQSSRTPTVGVEGPNDVQLSTAIDPQSPPLKSLTLENCPGLLIKTLEEAISTGKPFPYLDTLVLRDMFAPSFTRNFALLPKFSWTEPSTWQTKLPPDGESSSDDSLDRVDWCRAGHLLAISDLLAARRLGFSPLCPEGVGLASSVRDVVPASLPPGIHGAESQLKPFSLFYPIRLHSYLNSLFELDGSCGPLSLRRNRTMDVLFVTPVLSSPTSELPTKRKTDFVSQSTQTCVCGLLEWQILAHMSNPSAGVSLLTDVRKSFCPSRSESSPQCLTPSCSKTSAPLNCTSFTDNVLARQLHEHRPTFMRDDRNVMLSQLLQLGGPLSFHPFPPSVLHEEWFKLVIASDWTKKVSQDTALAGLFSYTALQSRLVYAIPVECAGCASGHSSRVSAGSAISEMNFETGLRHNARLWHAHDASVDTTELRCHVSSHPQVFNIFQPPDAPYSNLTSVHFEKVGVSHLVLCGAPHLKNITLENCTQLQAILFVPNPSNSTILPCLRRIRVLRCPKFAIYHLLHAVASLYPGHEENISITYRPFGLYDEQVERALWSGAHHAHVLVSHDYKQIESEREMEEFHSGFDQLFREVMNFADMLVRRELLVVNPKPDASVFTPSSFRRSEHGVDWNLVTDIPWIHEICCSILRASDSRRPDQADQFYEVLSEIQTAPNNLKLQRRGIHLHVQFRDVHSTLHSSTSKQFQTPISYLKHRYSEQYVASIHPRNDINAWGDDLDESLCCSLPPHVKHEQFHQTPDLETWQRLLLCQEESSRMSPTNESSPAKHSDSVTLKRCSFFGDTNQGVSGSKQPRLDHVESVPTKMRFPVATNTKITQSITRKRPSVVASTLDTVGGKKSRQVTSKHSHID